MQIIINAGGTGTRLWPYSTVSRPKQFSKLIDQQTFLAKTFDRLKPNFDPEIIWINTNQKFIDLVKESLGSDYNSQKILTEPEKRDHFAALIGHSAVVASKTSRTETQIFIHSDHLINPEDWSKYNQALKIVDQSIQNAEFEIVTCAVKPTFANTQLGYIEVDQSVRNEAFVKPVKVFSFREKPNFETATKFLESGCYFWNLGYYSFTFENLIKNLQKFHPELVQVAETIYQKGKIEPEDYQKIPKTSFDYAISEKTDSLGVVALDLFWEDIGSWEAAEKYLPALEENPNHFQISGAGNKVKLNSSNKKVAFVGVSNLILVESEEGILIINPQKSGEVKKVAEYFENN
jgi:mannose-1-phosphate guanylyltransferase